MKCIIYIFACNESHHNNNIDGAMLISLEIKIHKNII